MKYRPANLIVGFLLLCGCTLAQPIVPHSETLISGHWTRDRWCSTNFTQLLRRVEPYRRHFGPEVIQWTNSGISLYLKARAGGIRLLQSDEPGAIPRFWTELGSSNAYDVYLSPNARYAVFSSDKTGDEQFQLLFHDFSRAHDFGFCGTSRHTEFISSPSAKYQAISYSKRTDHFVRLAILEPKNPTSVRVVAKTPARYLKADDWSG